MNIKFRAWDKEKQRMLPVTLMDYNERWVSCEPVLEDKVNPAEYGERNSFSNEETDRHILMQYIGLEDDNGIEIYEGDILRTTEENGIDEFIDTFKIVWDVDKAGFMIEYLNNDEYYNLEEMPNCIVIGNIYG